RRPGLHSPGNLVKAQRRPGLSLWSPDLYPHSRYHKTGSTLVRADRSRSAMKKFKLDRIISLATLVASLVAIVLVLKKPAPVARPQAPAAIAEHAQSFDQKMAQF